MNTMTRKQALKKIFTDKSKEQTPQMRKWKSRHKTSGLSLDLQVVILKKNGYKKVKESEWKAPKKRN